MKRSAPLRRHTPLAPVNRKRRQTEFARTYHSSARVAWVKNLGCVYCTALHPLLAFGTAGRCHNAHTVSGGKGRKADYTTVIPLCAKHHQMYDDYANPFDNAVVRDAMKAAAEDIEAGWQRYVALKAAKQAKRPAAAKTTKASKDVRTENRAPSGVSANAGRDTDAGTRASRHVPPAPRCELCGDECVGKSATTFAEFGLCTTCLTGKHRRSA